MELVTYNEETGEWEENNSSSAYDYVAGMKQKIIIKVNGQMQG